MRLVYITLLFMLAVLPLAAQFGGANSGLSVPPGGSGGTVFQPASGSTTNEINSAATDTTTCFQVMDAAGNVVTSFDCTNRRQGIGTSVPSNELDIIRPTPVFRMRDDGGRNLLFEITAGVPRYRIATSGASSGNVLLFGTEHNGPVHFEVNSNNTILLKTTGGLDIEDIGSQPTCDATIRGTFFVDEGASSVKDAVEVCAKDAGDAYAWRVLY